MKGLPVTAAASAVIALALVAGAGPASAHEEISPQSVPTGRPAYLILSVANEKRVDLTRVTVNAPTGGQFGHATRDPEGWTSTLSHTTATFTGGAVKPTRFEQFGFDIESFGQPGTFTYKVSLGYADGTSSDADVPVVAVGAGDVSAPATTVAAGTTATTEDARDDGEDEAPAGTGDDAKGESRANLALGLSALALLAAGGAFLAGRKSAAAGTAPPATGPSGGGQDW